MSQSSVLDLFTDFALATREHVLTGPGQLESQASRYRSTLFKTMLQGLTPKKMIQSGKKIVDFVQLTYANSFSHYNPTDAFAFSDEESLTELEVPWRFSKVHSVIHEVELDLQSGNQADTFKRVRDAKESSRDLSWYEGMEDALWAKPDYEAMESPTAGSVSKPFSLRCFITDDGLFPSTTNGGVENAAFSTLMTVSSDKAAFRNQVETFDNTSDTTRRAAATGILKAMDRMWLKCQFQSPTDSQQYVKDTRLNKMKIVSNMPSQALLVDISRSMNDALSPKADLGWSQGQVLYHGIPTLYVPKLDNVDTDAANNPGEDATASDGAGMKGYRWRFVNFNHFHPIFHSKHFRRLTPNKAGASQPHSTVLFEDTWHQLWCSNRREQGIVRAAAA